MEVAKLPMLIGRTNRDVTSKIWGEWVTMWGSPKNKPIKPRVINLYQHVPAFYGNIGDCSWPGLQQLNLVNGAVPCSPLALLNFLSRRWRKLK